MNTVFFCHLAILVVILSNYHHGEAAITMDNTEKIRQECIKEANLNADETSRILARDLYNPKYTSTSDPLKCYAWCFHKKTSLIDASMNLNLDGFNELFILYFPDKKDKVKPALSKCSSIKAAKPCDLSYEFHGCVLKNI